jgi:hypothetical protein
MDTQVAVRMDTNRQEIKTVESIYNGRVPKMR